MAVDTRDKRFSLLGLGQAWGAPVVFPDPSVNGVQATEFEQWIYSYAGVQFTGPGDPRMKRWGGVTHMRVASPIGGRTW